MKRRGAILLAGLTAALAVIVTDAHAQRQNTEVQQLRQRVQQLEEQLVDMQVLIGTLQSLAQNARPAASNVAIAPGQPVAGGDPRVGALEMQVQALTAQLERLTGRKSSIVPAQPRQPGSRSDYLGRGTNYSAQPAASSQFGQTTVNQGTYQPFDQTPPRVERAPSRFAPQTDTGTTRQTSLGFGRTDNPQQAYEAAYGFLLQQNYQDAQDGFRDFLKRYPKNRLAGNAQYWLGETHYVQGRYKQAAMAFLAGYEKYGKGSKGPDSLLKLAMSLGKLGQSGAACSSLSELRTRYPQAPRQLIARAGEERRKLRC